MKLIDYRKFRLNLLNTPEFSHLLLLFYWPIYGLLFLSLERIFNFEYHPIACFLDDYIPFCEVFVIPYYFWFAFIGWMMIYTLLFDVPAFRKFSWFIIITYSITCVVYLFFPTMQELRPVAFERDNIFTRIVSLLYSFDTNTNVCPSLHVTGSMAVMFTAWSSERYSKPVWRVAFIVMTILICSSTVLLKQHSIIDIIAALVMCFAVYPLVFLYRPGCRFSCIIWRGYNKNKGAIGIKAGR